MNENTLNRERFVPSVEPKKRIRRRRVMVAAVATVIGCSLDTGVPMADAFQRETPFRRLTLTHRPLQAVTDPDVLLRDLGGKDDAELRELESLYLASAGSDLFYPHNEEEIENPDRAKSSSSPPSKTKEISDANSQQSSPNPPRVFKTLGVRRGESKKRASTKTASRSSTLHGFSRTRDTEERNDSIKVAEILSGKDYGNARELDDEKKRKAKRRNSIRMYEGSDAVSDSLVRYTDQIHQESRISPDEEKVLGKLTQEAIRIQSLYEKLEDNLGRVPTDDEWCAAAGKINMEAIGQAMEDGLAAKNKLITSNMRMVQGVVNLYIRNGLGGQYDAGDLMSEGTLGLIRAAEKFDPSRGFRFSTYAMYWIRAAVKQSQLFQNQVIHRPHRLVANHKRIQKIEADLEVELGRLPTVEEVCEAVKLSPMQVERTKRAMSQHVFSLDQQVYNNKKGTSITERETTMTDILSVGGPRDDHFQEKLDQGFLRDDLMETLHRHLSPAEVELILLRFGMMDYKRLPPGYEGSLTILQVSQLVGLKPDKVRRILLKSLNHLQGVLKREWKDLSID